MKKINFKYKSGAMLVIVAIIVVVGWGSIKKNVDVNSSATKRGESLENQEVNFKEN